MGEIESVGFDTVRQQQQELGDKGRAALNDKGGKSGAAVGFQAPGVVVCYTEDGDIQTGKKFATNGLQIAAGVPLQCDEPEGFQTFRLGLFGLDKLQIDERTVTNFTEVLEQVF